MNRRGGRGGRARGAGAPPVLPAGTPMAPPVRVEKDPLKGLLSRYSAIGDRLLAVRRTALKSGAVIEEVQVHFPAVAAIAATEQQQAVAARDAEDRWLSLLEAEGILNACKADEERERLLRRRSRLPVADRNTPLANMSEDNMRILRMSNSEYARSQRS